MKEYIKFLTKYLLVPITLIIFGACEEEQHVTDNHTIVATLSNSNTINELPISDDDAVFSSTLEVTTAPENGKTIEKIDLFVAFNDITNEGTDNSTENVLVESISSSVILNKINDGFRPEFDYMLSKKDMIATAGISDSDVDGGDTFLITFSVILNNGISHSHTITSTIVCPPTSGSGLETLTLLLEDEFNDGWDGASIDLVIDGESTNYTINGGEHGKRFEVNIPSDYESVELIYNPGSYETEHRFYLFTLDGVVLAKVDGNKPIPDAQVINFCILTKNCTNMPTPGTWILDMQDIFGDGWDGASLDITIDGVVTSYVLNGDEIQYTFDVPSGSTELSVFFNEVSLYEGERSYQLTSSSGSLVIDSKNWIVPGEQLLDFCAF